MASSCKHFVGLRGSDFAIVKSDAAGEILKVVIEQGWLSEASVPSRFPHNSHVEREIRSFQEVARSLVSSGRFRCTSTAVATGLQLCGPTYSLLVNPSFPVKVHSILCTILAQDEKGCSRCPWCGCCPF